MALEINCVDDIWYCFWRRIAGMIHSEKKIIRTCPDIGTVKDGSRLAGVKELMRIFSECTDPGRDIDTLDGAKTYAETLLGYASDYSGRAESLRSCPDSELPEVRYERSQLIMCSWTACGLGNDLKSYIKYYEEHVQSES